MSDLPLDPAILERWERAAAGRRERLDSAAARFGDLLRLMADLRGPQGCPWDREQSLASLRQYVREEADEVCRAVDAILTLEAELRASAGLAPANPEVPEGDDKARTAKKGHTIAHHPHHRDFHAANSASGAPLPSSLQQADRERLDALYASLTEELGDLALQVAFMGDILHAMGRPGAEDSLRLIIEKLIRRHPHVYGDKLAADSAEVLANWERIKQAEKGNPA